MAPKSFNPPVTPKKTKKLSTNSPAGQLLTQGAIEPQSGTTPRRKDDIDNSERLITEIRTQIGNCNNDDMLKCLECDIWRFIGNYCPASSIPVEELRERGRTMAAELELEFAEDDHFATIDDSIDTKEEQQQQQQEGDGDHPTDTSSAVSDKCKWFESHPSKHAKGETETKYFNKYVTMCNEINARGSHYNNVVRTVANRKLCSEILGSNFMIDGCLVSKTTGEQDKIIAKGLSTRDVLAVMEYKQYSNTENILDDRLKVVSAVTHIMLDDVRRRFMYAISVEDCQMTIWYFARDYCVRASFNWWQHKAIMISVFLSFMCATDEDLGLDPRIHLRPAQENHPSSTLKVKYIYELQIPKEKGEENDQEKERPYKTVYYRTENSILELRGLRITGRKTRVFEVVEVDSESDDAVHDDRPRKALKDAWMDADRTTESEIQQQMFNDIQTFIDSNPDTDNEHLCGWVENGRLCSTIAQYLDGGKDFRTLFLPVALESTGPPLRAIHAEYLRVPDTPTFYPQTNEALNGSLQPTSRTLSKSTDMERRNPKASLATKALAETNLRRRYSAKKRSFIIFNELCKPVYMLPDVGSAVHVLADAIIALFLMYCANWVHRDVSAGNIMVTFNATTNQWEVRLSDFEYARIFSLLTASIDPKTGTPYFMAAEILRGRYFEIATRENPGGFADLFSIKGSPAPSPDRPVHNFAHDVESVFWILYWIVTCRVGHQESQRHVAPVFSPDMGSNPYRDQALEYPISFAFKDALLPPLRGLVPELNNLRLFLWNNIVARNAGPGQLWQYPSSYSYIHFGAHAHLTSLDVPEEDWYKVPLVANNSKGLLNPLPVIDVATPLIVPGSNTLKGTKRGRKQEEDEEDKPAKRRFKNAGPSMLP